MILVVPRRITTLGKKDGLRLIQPSPKFYAAEKEGCLSNLLVIYAADRGI